MNSKEIRILSLLALDTVFFLLEVIIGYSVHSLALVADSFHMLNDIISLVIALWAVRYKNTKPADRYYTYGWQRAEILGALINAVFLIALCFTIVIDAIQRFFEPQEISQPKLVLVVGIAGLFSNGIGMVLFHEHGHSHSHGGGSGHDHKHGSDREEEEDIGMQHGNASSTDIRSYFPESIVERYNENSPLISQQDKATVKRKSMNMEGVFLHALGDALGNVGVIITALFIWKTDYSWKYYTDPLVSLILTVIIFSSALPLCRKSSKVLLQATPGHVNTNLVLKDITRLDLVKSVHDFHIWNLNEDISIASLHIELNTASNEGTSADVDNNKSINKTEFLKVVTQVREILHAYGVHSATIQPEFSAGPISRKPSYYGRTNQDSCLFDSTSKCDSHQCL
ncbi:Piso0_001109 [Millerozyma farinosa CBS 7064]|uniref:Piso0_001109 protein n=1 Tax=Pichia sorbitophila (strain ATCC MYA-4447 / BCRC 22081 / CBS 7064 / NBRC 10061 / NRRL Y-12695) TaxID=559304 RepID=G8YSE9_PICSO|nr:Piso0_001109 [Millerozyma farinosa CBS 7064]CCE79072.1 Piso0_001109 [Millerozyma farinosa CBS 7064]